MADQPTLTHFVVECETRNPLSEERKRDIAKTLSTSLRGTAVEREDEFDRDADIQVWHHVHDGFDNCRNCRRLAQDERNGAELTTF